MAIDMSAAVKAPARRPGRPAAPKPAPVVETPKTLREQREEGLNGLASIGQAICLIAGQLSDARAIGLHAPGLMRETAILAESYESVAGPIDTIIKVGPFAAVITAGLPLVLQILTNHKVVDATGFSGVVAPEVLDAQMRAEMAKMQAEALRENQRAIAAAQRAQADYETALREMQGAPQG